MDVALSFLTGFVVSFLGSIPPATINLKVIAIALEKNLKQALWFSAGASIMELVYSSIAVYFSGYISQNPNIEKWIVLFSIPVLFGLGIHSLFFTKNNIPIVNDSTNRVDTNKPFWNGLLLGIINPLNIPFWVFWTSNLMHGKWISNTELGLLLYIIGIVLGGFSLLVCVAYLSQRFHQRFLFDTKKTNQIIGILLIGLSLINLFSFLTA